MSGGNLQALLEPHAIAIGLENGIAWAKIEELGRQWLRFGRAMNLSGARDLPGLAEHVAEGLEVVALAQRLGCTGGEQWIDVGSGAGFPGLIVAACLPVEILLVEPRERRAAFLELMLAQLKAKGRVIRGRLEDDGVRDERGGLLKLAPFGWSSARAVFLPDVWLTRAQGLLSEQGVAVVHLHRGDADPLGRSAVAAVDGERWSIRGYRRFT